MSKDNAWRQLDDGTWTLSIGNYGDRVRLFQKRRGGQFYREVWLPEKGRPGRKCLQTRDRNEAARLGKRLHAALVLGVEQRKPGGPVTLSVLRDRFQTECPAYLDNKVSTRRDAESRFKVLHAFFGDEVDVRSLTARDQAAFATARKSGGIKLSNKDGDVTRPVRARTIEADLVLLHMMLNWATTIRVNGVRWLEFNPLQGIKRPQEANPRRPVATWERYTGTRAAIQQLAANAKTDEERLRWVKIELVLVLAHATGRRLSSIRHLRWEDLNVANGIIHWRAEHDKKGKAWTIPYPAEVWDEIKQFQRKLSAVGGWLFPGERLPGQPMDRHLFDKWLTVAEKAAELPKLEGGLWHPYRRAWATARKDLSLKDVAAAGGWSDIETLLKCYQQPDTETLLRVTSQERRIHEVVVGGRN